MNTPLNPIGVCRGTHGYNFHIFAPNYRLWILVIAKLGYAGVYLFFLFSLQNIDCGYSLEPNIDCGYSQEPLLQESTSATALMSCSNLRGGSNVYVRHVQSMF